MRLRWFALLVLLALLAVACPQQDTTETTDEAPAEEQPPSDEGEPEADRAEIAGRYAGDWSGSWTNRTFGSTGEASAVVTVQGEETMTVSLDLAGNVFGASDPPSEDFVIQLDGQGQTSGTSATYGPYEASWELDAGTITIDLTEVPGDRITTVSGSGTFSDTRFSVTFTINFSDGSSAESVLELTKS